MKEKKKQLFNRKGFTLVELLATIVVLSIVVSLTIYTALNIIGKAKEKGYKVTISNIESNASNYLLENKDKLNFISSSENTGTEYQCITVKNLIDYGYLKDNITKSKVNEIDTVELDRYIYVERNSTTKAITKVVYLMNNKYDQLCKTSIKSKANITFLANPEFDTWSKTKDVTITYGLSNVGTGLSGYTYNYNYTGNSTPKTDNGSFNQFTEVKTTSVNGNGTLLAEIKFNDESVITSSKEITKIDTVGPVIALNNNETKTVKATVTIPLKVTDVGSGINQGSFIKEDVIVKIGEKTITNITLTKGTCASANECIYNLKINDTTYAGKVKIIIGANKVLDKIDNGNNETNINTNITFDNTAKYKINHYVRNIGANTYTLSGTTEEKTGKINATLTLADLSIPIAGFTYDGGYTSGNTTRPTSGKKTTITLPANDNTVINLYYRRNYLYVQYNANGGTLADPHGEGYGLSNNLVTLTSGDSTQNKFKRGVYGGNVGNIVSNTLEATNGLHDWNSPSYINLTNTGKLAKKGAEWCTSSSGTCYDHSATTIKAVDMATAGGVDLSTGDKTITLYVNWMNVAEIPTNAYCKTGLVYNGSSQTITNNAGAGYTFSNNVQTNAGSYQVTATLKSGYVWSNGSSAGKTFSCSIGKIDATCPTLTAYSGDYDGKAHSITISGGSGGTIKYSTDNSTWKDTNPTRTEVGSTTVYVKVVGDSNHNDKACGSAKITITESGYTLTANANGGEIPETSGWTGAGSTATKKLTAGSAYGTLPVATKDNGCYILKGWYTAASGGTEVSANTKIGSSATTIYAHWQQSCYSTAWPYNPEICKSSNGGGEDAYFEDGHCWIVRDQCPGGWTNGCKMGSGGGGGLHCYADPSMNDCLWVSSCQNYSKMWCS